jgi:hypothetical protein
MTILHKFAYIFAAAVGILVISSSAFAQGAPLFAVLNGGNECKGSPPVCLQGDPNGFGSATIIFPTSTSVCFGIVVNRITGPTAAHIHSGASGISGPIVVTLTPPAVGNPGASSGCIHGVLGATIRAIREDPTLYYVNVHTNGFPDGAVRGQLQ